VAARLREGFAAAGEDAGTPDIDARLLVAAAAGLDAGDLPLSDALVAAPDVVARADAFSTRRLAGEPVARILGHREFYGLDLLLSADTLIPRPDTETVVDAALTFAAVRRDRQLRLADLGTGSGAILLALLAELPAATGVGVDISAAAAATARANARRLGLAARAAFLVGDWTAPLAGRFDIVVANPPYVASGDIAGLGREVRLHDPRRALDGGIDGLAAIRAIVAGLRRVLAPDGGVFIEIGAGQRDAVAALAGREGFDAAFVADLAGIDRVAALVLR
jgi:release factor glutamine methyltransferase